MQIIWLRLGIPFVYDMYRFTFYEKNIENNIFYMESGHSDLNHILKKMAIRTEGSNSQVTSRPEAVHSSSTSAIEGQQKMFQQSHQPAETTSTTSRAQKGNFSHVLNVRQESYSTWIVDSGASDHMTGNLMVFHEYSLL